MPLVRQRGNQPDSSEPTADCSQPLKVRAIIAVNTKKPPALLPKVPLRRGAVIKGRAASRRLHALQHRAHDRIAFEQVQLPHPDGR